MKVTRTQSRTIFEVYANSDDDIYFSGYADGMTLPVFERALTKPEAKKLIKALHSALEIAEQK